MKDTREFVEFSLEDVIPEWLEDNGYPLDSWGFYFELKGEKVDIMTEVKVFVEGEVADDG